MIRQEIPTWMCVLLVLMLTPFGHLAAQDISPNFNEVAADADAARDVNDVTRAIQLYTQALQLNPKWEDGWWSLGLLQYGNGSFALAAEALSHFVELNPQAGQGWALRGLCEFEVGKYQESLADIQKGLALGAATDSHNEQILHYHEAMLLTRLERYPEALRAYAPFAEHKLSNPELMIAIGLAGLRMPLLPEDVKPNQRELLTAVGEATFKFMSGDAQGAQLAFEDVFQRFPTAQNVHFHYGNLLYNLGADAAAPQFKKEVEIAPDNENALTMLAWSLLMDGRAEEALPYAKRIAAKQPEKPVAQLALGRALVDTGDIVGGLQHLEQALKLQPDNIEIHIALAKAYSKSGRADDARRERELSLQMSQNRASLAHP